MTILGPYSFINCIAEVGCLFGKDGVLALGAFIFLELTILVNNLCIIHGYERVLALPTIDDELGVTRIFPFEYVHP